MSVLSGRGNGIGQFHLTFSDSPYGSAYPAQTAGIGIRRINSRRIQRIKP
jgi:hypothetical protein